MLARHARTRGRDDLDVGRARADGVLPGDGHGRRVRPARLQAGGIRYWDAHRPGPLRRRSRRAPASSAASRRRPTRPTSGWRARSTCPAGGAQLSFWVARDTEPAWDYFFVEAHTAGADDWTTLPDLNGHTSQDTGSACPDWLGLHPFLAHYQTPTTATAPAPRPARPASGGPRAGTSDGLRAVDGRPRARTPASQVEVVAQLRQRRHRAARRRRRRRRRWSRPARARRRSRTTATRWTAGRCPGAPAGSPGNPNDWIAGTAADAPPTVGRAGRGVARPPAGDHRVPRRRLRPLPVLGRRRHRGRRSTGSASRWRTRPGRSTRRLLLRPLRPGRRRRRARARPPVVRRRPRRRAAGSTSGSTRGSPRYAEWLWSEREGRGTAQEIFDRLRRSSRPTTRSGRWRSATRARTACSTAPVYVRGAMTLHALRLAVGDDAFFRILRDVGATRTPAATSPRTSSSRLAERSPARQLDDLFETWLFTPGKPAGLARRGARRAGPAGYDRTARGPRRRRRALPPRSAAMTGAAPPPRKTLGRRGRPAPAPKNGSGGERQGRLLVVQRVEHVQPRGPPRRQDRRADAGQDGDEREAGERRHRAATARRRTATAPGSRAPRAARRARGRAPRRSAP